MSDAPATNDNQDNNGECPTEPPPPKKSKTSDSSPANDAAPLAAPSTSSSALPPLFDPATTAAYVAFHKSYQLPRKKTKHLPVAVLSARRQIQLSCRHNDLHAALQTLRHAMAHGIYVEPQSLYNLMNLCEGSFGERERMGRVHVGTPRRRGEDEGGKEQNGSHAEGNDRDHDGADKDREEEHETAVFHRPSTQGTNQTLPTNISLAQRLHYGDSLHSLLRQLHIPCTEPTYTALIRLAARAGDMARAEAYLNEAEGTPQCKLRLRMYSALIRGYCGDFRQNRNEEDGGGGGKDPTREEDLVKALKVWERMYRRSGASPHDHNTDERGGEDTALFGEGVSPKIQLTEVEYPSLMKCATELRDASVMERVLSDLAERVLVPGLETTETVLNWFRQCGGASAEKGSSAVEQVTLPPREGASIGSVGNECGKGWMIYRGCTVDSNTGELTLGNLEGVSSCHGEDMEQSTVPSFQLKPVELSETAWEEMRRMNQAIVLEGQVEGHVSQFQGGGKGKKRPRGGGGENGSNSKPDNQNAGNDKRHHNNKRGNEWRIQAWKQFETFLQNHPTYDTVIDGANVGYFQQNFSNAPKHVDYRQIDWLLRHLLEGTTDGRRRQSHIVLFLHERHFSPKLYPPWASSILRAWDGNRPPYDRLTVYRTPGGMNDDWYWMHAALLYGGTRNDRPPVLAVTNDEMRDHHFQMLAQGSFLRWKERHQIHFDFGGWNKGLGRREVLLRYPSAYSRRIQRLSVDDGEAIVIPLPKKGDEGRYVDGVHEADESAPVEETYVVIRRVS